MELPPGAAALIVQRSRNVRSRRRFSIQKREQRTIGTLRVLDAERFGNAGAVGRISLGAMLDVPTLDLERCAAD